MFANQVHANAVPGLQVSQCCCNAVQCRNCMLCISTGRTGQYKNNTKQLQGQLKLFVCHYSTPELKKPCAVQAAPCSSLLPPKKKIFCLTKKLPGPYNIRPACCGASILEKQAQYQNRPTTTEVRAQQNNIPSFITATFHRSNPKGGTTFSFPAGNKEIKTVHDKQTHLMSRDHW